MSTLSRLLAFDECIMHPFKLSGLIETLEKVCVIHLSPRQTVVTSFRVVTYHLNGHFKANIPVGTFT